MRRSYRIDDDLIEDGGFTFTPGLGRTRSRPRGQQYWNSRAHSRDRDRYLNQVGHRDRYQLDRENGRQNRDRERSPGTGRSLPPISGLYDSYRSRYRFDPAREYYDANGIRRRFKSESDLPRDSLRDPRDDSTAYHHRQTENGDSTQINSVPKDEDMDDEVKVETGTSDALRRFDYLRPVQEDFAEAQRRRAEGRADGRSLLTENNPFSYRDTRRSDDSFLRRHDIPRIRGTESSNSRPDDHRSAAYASRSTILTTFIKKEPDDDNGIFSEDGRGLPSASVTPKDETGSLNGRAESIVSISSSLSPEPPLTRSRRVPRECECPKDLDCPARDGQLIDCRTLVVELKRWNHRDRTENVESLPLDVEAADEVFVTVYQASQIVRLVQDVESRRALSNDLKQTFNLIVCWINEMCSKSIRGGDLIDSNALPTIQTFLSDGNAQHRRAKHVPPRIEQGLTILMRKWEAGDYSQLPRRGLIRRTPRGPLRPDPNWPHRRSSQYFGHGNLVNSQIWLCRAAMCRDGAHGPPIAGISGKKDTGAYSVVMGYHDTAKREYYADVDCGETIFYISTALPKPRDENGREINQATNLKDDPDAVLHFDTTGAMATSGAQALIKSHDTQLPVRMFRSWRASAIVPHRPKKGFRYDGLYTVADFECLKAERQIYRFKMNRLTQTEGEYGQGPLISPEDIH